MRYDERAIKTRDHSVLRNYYSFVYQWSLSIPKPNSISIFNAPIEFQRIQHTTSQSHRIITRYKNHTLFPYDSWQSGIRIHPVSQRSTCTHAKRWIGIEWSILCLPGRSASQSRSYGVIENYLVTRLIDCDPLTRSYITGIHGRSYLTLQRFCLFFREDPLLSPPLARCLSRRGVLAGSGRPINPIRHGSSSARAAVLQFMNLLWAPPRIPRGLCYWFIVTLR